MKTFFLDIETTGVTREDKIASVAIVDEEMELYELINEGKKIPPLASMHNHITNEMIADAQEFHKSDSYDYLQQHNLKQNFCVVANALFVEQMLCSHGLFFEGEFIDVLRVSKHLIPECEQYSLEFLRYELKLYKKEITPLGCSALDDAYKIGHLFEYLLELCSLEEMADLSKKKVLLEKFHFGKYLNRYIEEIVAVDRAYVNWMLSLEELDEDLRYSLHHYMEG